MNDKIEKKDIKETSAEEVKVEETSTEEVKAEETSTEEVKAEETSAEEVKAEENSTEEVKAEETSKEDKINVFASFLLGKKIGMTSTYSEDGMQFPTTIIEAGPCYVSQLKTLKNDGYEAVQIGYKEDKKANKPKTFHFKKSNISPMKYISEFKVDSNKEFALGEELRVNIFQLGDYVKVSGISKGKGFAGVMKRHGFGGGRASHGKNSVMRKSGSVGAGTDPGRIFPGMKMAGRMGNDKVTVKNLEVLNIDYINNLIFIKGALPGSNNNYLYLTKK